MLHQLAAKQSDIFKHEIDTLINENTIAISTVTAMLALIIAQV